VELRPLASDVPAIVRLRIALKRLLRCHGLRAVDVREIPAGDKQTSKPPTAKDITRVSSKTCKNRPRVQQTLANVEAGGGTA
jgi:hypothetical protein